MSAPPAARPSSLTELLRKSIVDAISTAAEPGRWRVVVADRPSLSIISSVLKMHTIMEHSVVAIQLITRSRQPYPDMDAVYVLLPTAESVSRALGDFEGGPSAAGTPLRKYARAHLLFTGALPESLLAHLRSSTAAQYIRTIAQIFVEYNPIESRVFLTTPSEQPFYALYSPHALHMVANELNAAADRVLSTVASLGIRPYVRYYRPPLSAAYVPSRPSVAAGDCTGTACPRIAEAMAARIQRKLDEHFAQQQGDRGQHRDRAAAADAAPSVIIVLDRSVDMCAPLLHDFSYQAIVHDLLDLESGRKYIYEAEGADGQTRRVEAELTEDTDELWKKFRHWHIADVSQALADEFEQLVSKSEEIQIACKGHKMGVRQMKAALSGLPDFRRLQDAYSLHIDLASKCLGIIKQGILTTLSDFEQDLISGKDSLGEDVGREALEMRLISLLDDHTLDASDRIRILFIYLVCVNGGAALDRRRLEEVPQCMSTNDKRAAVGLRRLGIQTDKGDEDEELSESAERYTWSAVAPTDSSGRRPLVVPAVKQIVNEHVMSALSADMFPWTTEAPPSSGPAHMLEPQAKSLRRGKSMAPKLRKPQQAASGKGGVVIVYIAGGVTFSEMRAVYELADQLNREIYIGSTHVITPRGFLDDLKSLHLEMLT